MLSDEIQAAIMARSDLKPKRRGGRVTFRCLRHDDKTPSAWTAGGAHGCFSCGFEESIKTLAPLVGVILHGDGGYTLEDYADAKGFSVETLAGYGLTTTKYGDKDVVRIPFYDENGDELRARFRAGSKKWWEGKNRPIYLYGRDRLVDAKPGDRVMIVEGESDCHALWSSGILAVGCPGATTWQSDWAEYLDGLEVYVWEEPDQGGAQMVERLVKSFPNARIVRHDKAKDASELRQLLGSAFAAEITAAMDLARPHGSPEPPCAFEFVSGAELESRPAPTALVHGIIYDGALNCVFGKPGTAKTFFALDVAHCVATGTPWAGRAVQRGDVVYVSGEGASGLGQRIQAWRESQHVPAVEGVHFILEAVPLMDHDAIRQFVSAIKERTETPRLVVFDTLARCTLGMEENSAKDMGLAIAGADIVRRELGCAVLLIHHTNATGERERGSTALEGAVDVLMWMQSDQSGITLGCKKSKDSELFEDIRFNLTKCRNSVVLTPNMDVGVRGGFLSAGQVLTLKSLHNSAMDDGLTVTRWLDVSGQKSSTFYGNRKALCDRGFVSQDRDGRGARYIVTEQGVDALTPITPRSLQEGSGVTCPITSYEGPPLGGPEFGVTGVEEGA